MRGGLGIAIGALLVGALLCSGWNPLGWLGAAGSAWGMAKLGAWAGVTAVGLVAGPCLVAWAFLKGPPRRGDGADAFASLGLGLAGLVLTGLAVVRLPLLVAVATAWWWA